MTAWNKPGFANTWEPEHDAKLTELLAMGLSFAQCRPEMLKAFPSKTWTRNAILGRAARKGMQSKHARGRDKGYGLAKPVKVKVQENYVRKALVKKASAPVVFKQADPTLLRHEGDRGAANSPRGSRRLGLNDPVVIERKKGTAIAIIEEKPLTSVPVAHCERESCMWPTSEDVACMEVCGARVEVGAYCARHAAVAYRVLPTARRNGVRHKEDREHERRMDGSHHRHALDPDGEWLTRMIMDEVITAPADEPPLLIPHFIGAK